MKKISIILLALISVLLLSACKEDNKAISFNINHGETLTQYVDEDEVILDELEVYDYLGNSLVSEVMISGSYSLDTPGRYEINLYVTDAEGNEGERTVNLEILEKTCEMDSTQDKCIIVVESIDFTTEMDDITSVYIDDFIYLDYVITPLDAANQDIRVSTSNEDIATVSDYGYVFGKSEGTVTITFTTVDGNHSVSKQIEVLSKTCEIDPLQDKCAMDILGDDSRIVTLSAANQSGTDYTEIYVNNKIYYEIYVRTFADSDGNNKGDFQGIIDNLAYLKSIGVGGIWLMPITESRSDHGYEVDDYMDVDSEYGTMVDFEELISVAHSMDIDIIIDLVVNHMGAYNDIFQNVLQNGVNSSYYDWFTWIDSSDPRYGTKGSWGQTIWYNPTSRTWLRDGSYTIHSSLEGIYYCAYFSDWMPDLNLENPEVRDYLKDVAEFWLVDKGIDGFRMDATSHFYGQNEHLGLNNHHENLDFLDEYNTYMKTLNPDVFVTVEAWESYQTYTEYHSTGVTAFNFQAKYTIADAVRGYLSQDIGTSLNYVYNEIEKYSADYIDAPFISNHDMDRIARSANADLAAEILLTLPGNPFIYYGDEIGMIGTRTNMVWGDYYDSLYANHEDRNIQTVSEQLTNPVSILNTYKNLGQARNNSLALSYGDFIPYESEHIEGYYRVFENGEDKELVVVLFNFTSVFYVPIPSEFTSYEILYASNDTNLGGISPKSTMVIRLPWDLKDDLIN